MKFVIIFALCFAAFAAADEEVTEQISEEMFRAGIEVLIEEYTIDKDCKNLEEKCDEYVSSENDLASAEGKAGKKICVTFVKGYLCEGKNKGEKFTALVKEFNEEISEFAKLHGE